jgi:SAM-dependent methyltransferase
VTNTDRRYFEEIYASDPDPWGFQSRWYEQRKYALTMAALPEARYRSAFEPGCSIGVLSALLAPRCDQLIATEIIPSALAQARQRLAPYPHVRLSEEAIPAHWPDGPFDLVVLSEIAYYFDAATLAGIVDRLLGTMERGATLVGVHWRGPTDYPLSGDAAHEILDDRRSLVRTVHHVEADVLLDVWRREP